MASVTLEILISGDDIYTNNLPQFFTSANYADMGNVSGYNADSIFRFDNVGIGPGSTIITAYLRLRCKNSQSGETCNLNIYFEDLLSH